MKTKRISMLVAFAGFASLFVGPALWSLAADGLPQPLPGAGDGIQWLTDYEEARKVSKARGLPLLMEIGVEGCPWCRQMDTVTFADPAVVQKLKAGWICLRVDGRKSQNLVSALNLRNYPTHVYADSNGKILGSNEGFIESKNFLGALDKALGTNTEPQVGWMQGVFQEAQKARANKDNARALALLRILSEEVAGGSLRDQAKAMVLEMENEANAEAVQAKKLADGGNLQEAIETARKVVGTYGGTGAAREGEKLLATLASRNGELSGKSPTEKGPASMLELLEAEKKSGKIASFLELSERLVANYPESGEAKLAREESQAIRNDPDRLKLAADQAAERLASLYMNLADAWIAQGKPQQGVYYLERVVVTFPGSRFAEVAQSRIAQIQGPPALGAIPPVKP